MVVKAADLQVRSASIEAHRRVRVGVWLIGAPDTLDRPRRVQVSHRGSEGKRQTRQVIRGDVAQALTLEGHGVLGVPRGVYGPLEPRHIWQVHERAAGREGSQEARKRGAILEEAWPCWWLLADIAVRSIGEKPRIDEATHDWIRRLEHLGQSCQHVVAIEREAGFRHQTIAQHSARDRRIVLQERSRE